MAKKMTVDGNTAVSHVAYAFSEVAAIYLLFSTILTFIQRAGERRLSSYGKRDGKRKA